MNDPYSTQPKSGGAGKFVFLLLLVFVVGIAYLAYALIKPGGDAPSNTDGHGKDTASNNSTNTNNTNTSTGNTNTGGNGDRIELNIAYGTEKKLWLDWALSEYEKTAAGQRVKINLIGRGSVEGAMEVIQGPGKTPIHVWSPASAVYRDVFETEWEARHGTSKPIIKSESLALSPMVYVMWKERSESLRSKYPKVTFQALTSAMQEEGGWNTLAGKPEWGFFKFSHTHPNKSNSGLVTLTLMAYDFAGKDRDLSLADVTNPEFQQWLVKFERGVARPSGSLQNSTGTLMKEMVSRGPSFYDCIIVYENLAIDYLKQAQGRWGDLAIFYPERNIWNDNPYYILDVPWSSAEQRAAASDFLDFLMSEPIQRRALDHGFRPGNLSVPIKFAQSPFVIYEKYGLKIDVPLVCQTPKAAVLTNLIQAFQRIEN